MSNQKLGFKACGLFPWAPENINFSKCLGRKEKDRGKTSESWSRSSNESFRDLNYEKFCDLLGPEKCNQIKQFKDKAANGHEEKCEDFRLLCKIFEEFSKDENLIRIHTDEKLPSGEASCSARL